MKEELETSQEQAQQLFQVLAAKKILEPGDYCNFSQSRSFITESMNKYNTFLIRPLARTATSVSLQTESR